MVPLIALLPLYFVTTTTAMIGFDCGGPQLNHTTISLLDIEDCDTPRLTVNVTKTYVQLLQLSDYDHTEVIQCKIKIKRTVLHCGMYSHTSAVHNGIAEYLLETDYERCRRLHQDGTMSLGNNLIITGIHANSTTHHSVTFAGKIDTDGSCKGTTYVDPYGSWDDVIVQGIIEVQLHNQVSPIKLKSGKIILPSGTICELSRGSCIDFEYGYTFWKPMPVDACHLTSYDILYEGIVDKIVENIQPRTAAVYSITTEETTFALAIRDEHLVCGYTLLRTEHPRLFVLEIQPGNTFIKKKPVSVDNLDIFTYINSKFVYVERYVRSQLTDLYTNVMTQKCKLEQQVIKNALSLVTSMPDEFAYIMAKTPGYIAINAGEAIHILQCTPVEVQLRRTEECYNELPVTYANQSYFLTPKTRILTKFANTRTCNHLLPVIYKIDDTWIQLTPVPRTTATPQKVKLLTNLKWSYLTPKTLATSGIYTDSELQTLRDHIMFPAEKPAMLNEIARNVVNPDLPLNTISISGLLDENSLQKIASNTMHNIWNGFIEFGSISAGILAIYVSVKIIKAIIDTVIHGYTLHSLYGCSLHVLGALCSSITYLLVHLASRTPPTNEEDPTPEDCPKPNVPITPSTSDLNKTFTISSEPSRRKTVLFQNVNELCASSTDD